LQQKSPGAIFDIAQAMARRVATKEGGRKNGAAAPFRKLS